MDRQGSGYPVARKSNPREHLTQPPSPADQRHDLVAPPNALANLDVLQRLAGNQAVAELIAGRTPGLQRLALVDGPPLAPGNYRYGNYIVGVDTKSMRGLLTDMAGRDGLTAERKWQADFVADMKGTPSGKVHKYEDPVKKQTVSVEPTMATNVGDGQRGIEDGVKAAQRQFQQDLLGTVGGMLDSTERKAKAEAKRYGFHTEESIFNPTQKNAGQLAISASLPESEEVRGLIRAAKILLDGKRKLKKVREETVKLGPILGDTMRPSTLEPATKEYYELRQKQSTQFPILASFERDDVRLAELASGAQFAKPGSTGQAATSAVMAAQESIRKDLADKLSNIAYVRDNMKDEDKIKNLWANPSLRDGTKRKMGIAAGTFPNAAVDDKVRDLKEEAEFSAKLKMAIGAALLLASLIPGAGLVAGGIGVVMGAVDVYGAFQDFYWEQAAAGTAMDKAEAISQSDPSLFALGTAIAVGLLEGVAEVKALEGAITVFKAIKGAYREARTAAAVAKVASGTAKGTGAAEVLAAQKKLQVAAEAASERPGFGPQVVATAMGDATEMATDLKNALRKIKDPALKELIIKASRENPNEVSLADLAVVDADRLQADYNTWKKISREKNNPEKFKRFDDWLRDRRAPQPHDIITDPAGLVEYSLDSAGAKRSFEVMLSDDPSREAGIYRDPATGEHVVVQGGSSFVEAEAWQKLAENYRNGYRPNWILVTHYHPNRGLLIDRLPSRPDFNLVAGDALAVGSRVPVSSTIYWNDPVSKIRFVTEFGYIPGAPRPFWTRYRVDDGTMKIASFKDPPWGAGEAEYLAFLHNKKLTDPATPVPGGNVMPVAPPLPTPPGAGGNILKPPPKPAR